WSEADEAAFIEYLVEHRADAGDGGGFKTNVWVGLADMLNKLPTDGLSKTASKCRSKWTRAHTVYTMVMQLKNLSGYKYSDVNGIIVDPENSKWKEYCMYLQKNPGAERFVGRAWPHYKAMSCFMPSQARGVH
ncbi:hypothetical protein K439DRAFT_1243776, partial [Ramaria rubella]